VLLLGLGTWQVQRLDWKEGLIAERNAALAAAPVPLPKTVDDARSLAFHPVRAEGEFLNDREIHLNAQSLKGDAGFHIITPLRLSDGAIVFVVLILGALVVGLAILVEIEFAPPMWVHLLLWTPVVIGGAIALLRPLKAWLIAMQYRHHLLDA